MAKRAGIEVEEFGFGLPPRAWGKKIGKTIYSINWLPFGGFVRLVGEDPTDKRKDQKNSFYSKSLRERMLVVLAGVAMNFILAVGIFYVVVFALGFKVSLPLLYDHKFKFVNQEKQVLVEDVAQGSIAQAAGIKPGEAIVAAGGQDIVTIEQLQKIIRANENQSVGLIIENPVNNKTRAVTVVPKLNEQLKVPAIGVGLGELAVLDYKTFPQKLFSGFIHSYNTVDYSIGIFGKLIGAAVKSHNIAPVSEGVSGPVGIAQLTSQAVKMGALSVLQLAALLSLNLAVMNVLPIPALDGGRFFFLVMEAVTRRKVYPTVEKWVHTVGFVVLIGLILLITFNDISKLIK